MKKFTEFVNQKETVLSEAGRFSNPGTFEQNIVYVPQEKHYYDESGTPFDDEPLRSFLLNTGKLRNADMFVLNIDHTTSGYSHPEKAVGGAYDAQTDVDDIQLFDDGTPVPLPPNIKKAFVDHYHGKF